MLDPAISEQLRAHFEKLVAPIELVIAGDSSTVSDEIRALVADLVALSPRITSRDETSTEVRRPHFPSAVSENRRGSGLPACPWVTSSPR